MKVIAFHLPQFHRIPENDTWWGEGFTEWTNTAKAKPRFLGHRQPRVPLDNNYYDLTNPATQAWQAKLAQENGIHGFCYYHYWFGGKKLLEKPVEIILDSKKPDIPFCFAWANEPWTRSWDGLESQVLMPQNYGGRAEWKDHYDYLRTFFLDSRYIKVEGKPMFLIYRCRSIPSFSEMAQTMSQWAKADGFPGIHFVQMLTSFDGSAVGAPFDMSVYFEPMYTMSNNLPLSYRLYKGARNWLRDFTLRNGLCFASLHNRVPYSLIWQQILAKPVDKKIYPGAFVDWDNTARKGAKAMTCDGVSPKSFGLHFQKQYGRHKAAGLDFIFINAWNEWAEGAVLEPDADHAFDYLTAVRSAVKSSHDLK